MKDKLTALAKALQAAGYKTVEVQPGRRDQVDVLCLPGMHLADDKNFAALRPLKESGLVADLQLFDGRLYLRNVHDPKTATATPPKKEPAAPPSGSDTRHPTRDTKKE